MIMDDLLEANTLIQMFQHTWENSIHDYETGSWLVRTQHADSIFQHTWENLIHDDETGSWLVRTQHADSIFKHTWENSIHDDETGSWVQNEDINSCFYVLIQLSGHSSETVKPITSQEKMRHTLTRITHSWDMAICCHLYVNLSRSQ